MIFLTGALAVFWLVLGFYKPQNVSLKDNSVKPAFARLLEVKATLILGTLLITTAMLTFDMSELQLTPEATGHFGLGKAGVLDFGKIFQPLTSIFLHFDFLHLVANTSALLFVAPYERRVGFSRYLAVFAIAALATNILVLFLIGPETVAVGASAGIAGLACGYFIDWGTLSLKDWFAGITLALVVIAAASIQGARDTLSMGYEVNWAAHVLGVLFAAMFIKVSER